MRSPDPTLTSISFNFKTAMARRANLSTGRHEQEEAQRNAESTRQGHERVNSNSMSPSPAASFSSDKENRQVQADEARYNDIKAKSMLPPQMPTPSSASHDSPRSSKKRKLGDRNATNASQTAHERELAEVGDRRFYDPEQSMDERRAVRKDFRDLSRELTGTRCMTSDRETCH